MKPIRLLFIAALLFTGLANAQITKGNWMVGGNGSFSYTNSKSEQSSSSTKDYTINLSPNIGYFVYDKLALGSKLNYVLSKYYTEQGNSEFTFSTVGPFVRYYFLKEEKVTNLFLESSYTFSIDNKNKNSVFATKAGTVIFLNSSVGFEISLEYLLKKYNSGDKSSGLLLGFGLQIHLEKEK